MKAIIILIFIRVININAQVNFLGNSDFETTDNGNSELDLLFWSERNNNSVVNRFPSDNVQNRCFPSFFTSVSPNCLNNKNFNIQNDCGNGTINFSINEDANPLCGGKSSCGGQLITAHSGTRFIGLEGGNEGDKDGIDNDFGEPLELNTEYKISFFFLMPFPTDLRALDFRIFLSPNKKNSKIEIVHLTTSDFANFAPGTWNKFEKNFMLLNDDDNDLHVLSLINFTCVSVINPDNGEPFETIFIDDVTLMTACTDPCSPFVGKFNIFAPETNNGITADAPFCLRGLDNVSSADVSITNVPGQVLQSFTLTNPKDQICFDIPPQALESVNLKLTVRNDCRIKTFDFNVTKLQQFERNQSNLTTWGPFLPPFSAVTKISKNTCCNGDLKIENRILNETLVFESPVKITLGPYVTITSTADITLKAGQTIDVIQPVNMDNDAKLLLEIVPCTPPPVDFTVQTIPNKIDFTKDYFNHKDLNIMSFTLYPNPTTNNFGVNLYNYDNKPYQVSLADITGKNILNNQYDGKVSNCQIETNDLSNGVYFVTIRCGDKVKVEKLIIQAKAEY